MHDLVHQYGEGLTLHRVPEDAATERWLPPIGMGMQLESTDFLREAATPTVSTFWPLLLYYLASSASIGRRNPRYVEIGTQRGCSTLALLTAAEKYNGTVRSIDCDPACEAITRERLYEKHCESLLSRWTFTAGMSQSAAVEDGPIDFLLVDGSHIYESVCGDMARWGPQVRVGGLIALDDYTANMPGKVRWIQERWRRLQPMVVIGACAVIYRMPHHTAAFLQDERGKDSWEWYCEVRT